MINYSAELIYSNRSVNILVYSEVNHRSQELGDFLKSRSTRVLPSQVGLPEGARRRTPGLRREEVTQLAGIGLTWYTWLEQGRPIKVSATVVESLSRVLLLDEQERQHLYLLANQTPPPVMPSYEGAVSPVLQNVIDSLALSPTLVIDGRFNIIAWNKVASVLFGEFVALNSRERNIVWATFTNKNYIDLFLDWEPYAKNVLARFRAACGQYIDDPWIVRFVEELKEASEEFRTWWPLHEIQIDTGLYRDIYHSIAGKLDFNVSTFDVSDNSGLKMIVYSPGPGTDTAEKIETLMGQENTT